MSVNMYENGLGRSPANFVPLTPISFLDRAAQIAPDGVAVVFENKIFTWRQTLERSKRLASALISKGIKKGDTVSILAANIPEMYEAHFGVPMAQAVLNAINTRLDHSAVSFILKHAESKVFIVDSFYLDLAKRALSQLQILPTILIIEDSMSERVESSNWFSYEEFLKEGNPNFQWAPPDDEWQAIALNYTSGTTGDPKGVVYHHRGAFLDAVSNVLAWDMPQKPIYLWTLPMFHCNGWCFPWSVAMQVGTNICLRKVDPQLISSLVDQYSVTHYTGAPIVHHALMRFCREQGKIFAHEVNALVGGASPPAAMIEGLESIGIRVTHGYGLTETYGATVTCGLREEWRNLSPRERADRIGRQGVRYPLQFAVDVMDPNTMKPVPRDGATLGEVMVKGSIVMSGYLKNPSATEVAFKGGWFHTGDLAVMCEDGNIKVKDRAKDIIISGGENISSLEIEEVLYRHPAVGLAAAVAQPDIKWGESPCVFVELRPGMTCTEEELVEFCRENMAHFKIPKKIVFCEIPKTATGKIQKHILRTKVKSTSAIE